MAEYFSEMGDDTNKRSHHDDTERKSKKRHKNNGHGDSRKRKRNRNTDNNPDNEDIWVEKATDIPSTESFKSTPSSSKEQNTDIGPSNAMSIDQSTPSTSQKANTPGGPGSQWRMMRLRRVYETAEEENKPIHEIAIDRFGSLESFEEAKEERRILDEREGKKSERGRLLHGKGKIRGGEEGTKGFMFTDVGGSGASSRSSSFKRPGGAAERTPSSTPSPHPQNRRFDSLRLPSQAASPLAQSHTPIPTVMTTSSSKTAGALSPSSLNKLQAKVLRAKLMGAPDAETLEQQYDEAVRNTNGGASSVEGGVQKKVEILPSLDAYGQLYDVGSGKDDGDILPGNRKKKEKARCCILMNTNNNLIPCLDSLV